MTISAGSQGLSEPAQNPYRRWDYWPTEQR